MLFLQMKKSKEGRMDNNYLIQGIQSEINSNKYKVRKMLAKFFWSPLKSGLIGFTAFFTVLVITKLLSYLIGTREYFVIEIEDITVSFIGFILLYLFTVVEQFKERQEKKS